ncbi:MAG: hypothetical protein LV480_13110 [Methylacidiphilales bacterium]|nr:hypothetical protein [Candidatus Methylacidiphilales bacterium]
MLTPGPRLTELPYEAVRDQTKCVDLKQVNRVLLQPHWRNDADFLPTALPS